MAYMYTTTIVALHGRESRVTIQSRGELDDWSSMTATPGKYIYIYVQDTANGGKTICDIITGKYNFNRYHTDKGG